MGETRPTVMDRSVIDGVPIQIEDLQCAPESEFPLGRKMALEWGHRTTLAVPLRRENRSLGAILLRWPEVRLFSEKQISLLKDERRFLECGQHVIVPLSAARHGA